MRERKRISDTCFTLSALMGPQEANVLGNVHGGVIMKMVDEAGALVAMRHAGNPVVTVAMDSMTFLEPIMVGHLVMCSAELTYAGRTSMEVRVEVVTENPLRGEAKKTNIGYVVYVAIDANGHPTEVPEIEYETPEQRIRAEHAQRRQAYRKQQRDLEKSVSLPEEQQTSALVRILSDAGARRILEAAAPELGLSDVPPYPFMAVVGQFEMRIALMLSVINPAVGGVLLIGPRGTGKTTAVRSLTGILPDVEVSDCEDDALPTDMEQPNADVLYPDCYEKYAAGQPISHYEAVRLVELPLNARLEDVVGGVNERVAVQQNRVRVERGILARADKNLLYIDEVNLLNDEIVDAILDAAAQGHYTVRRGAMAGTYRARFVLIGSMNPEEGRLRPQIMDRFGLRVNVRGLTSKPERLEVYQRVSQYRQSPYAFVRQWELATAETREEVMLARELLKETTLSDEAVELGLSLVHDLDIDSHRAEYTMFEAARAYAAADGRDIATVGDIRAVAPMALRQRRSEFMVNFFESQQAEDEQIRARIDHLIGT